MRQLSMYFAGVTVAAVVALAAIQPAKALPFANGSFTIVPKPGAGPVTVDTGNITLLTSSKTEPALVVQAVIGNLTATISPNDAVVLSNPTLPVPPGVGIISPVNFTLSVGGLVFAFDTAFTTSRVGVDLIQNISGSFSEQFEGWLINGGGIFVNGTPATLSEACTQSVSRGVAGLISCTNSLIDIQSIPEPATLAILGASLFGFGLLRRRRKSA